MKNNKLSIPLRAAVYKTASTLFNWHFVSFKAVILRFGYARFCCSHVVVLFGLHSALTPTRDAVRGADIVSSCGFVAGAEFCHSLYPSNGRRARR